MSKPIPIGSRGKLPSASVGGAPMAPFLGSLPTPHMLEAHAALPELSLPESTPEAFSMAEAASQDLAQRLIGVCSAPARTFIGQAAKARTEGGSALGVDFSKQGGGGTAASGALSELLKGGPGASTAAGAASGEEAAALSSAMRRLGVSEGGAAVGPTSGLQYSDLAPLVGSYGTRLPGRGVTLATSFRDPHHIPLQPAIREEGEAGAAGVEENSDEEWAERAERGIGGRAKQGRGVVVVEGGSGAREGGAGEDSSDEEEGGAGGGGRGLGGDEDEGVFGDLH